MVSSICNAVFERVINDYHVADDIYAPLNNPFPKDAFEHLLYYKNWLDTVQWHQEDIIRNPMIDPVKALEMKRRIDKNNQDRTDVVEQIDNHFLQQFLNITALPDATVNTESPAWAIDRLSVLALKIYHMTAEVNRPEASEEHQAKCAAKLAILLEQRKDLSLSIDQLLADIGSGKKIMKVYRQMKMYNDPSMNPVLYQQQKQ